jgi:hypothetical protein
MMQISWGIYISNVTTQKHIISRRLADHMTPSICKCWRYLHRQAAVGVGRPRTSPWSSTYNSYNKPLHGPCNGRKYGAIPVVWQSPRNSNLPALGNVCRVLTSPKTWQPTEQHTQQTDPLSWSPCQRKLHHRAHPSLRMYLQWSCALSNQHHSKTNIPPCELWGCLQISAATANTDLSQVP